MSNDYFNEAYEEVLKLEGGISNHPSDPGGLTKNGISLRFYKTLNRSANADDLLNLSEVDIACIYFEHFWKPLKCSEINDKDIALKFFNFGVNAGQGQATICLQRACNHQIIETLLYPLVVDGKIGSKTLNVINSLNSGKLLAEFTEEIKLFYGNIIQKNKELEAFAKGWNNRANS